MVRLSTSQRSFPILSSVMLVAAVMASSDAAALPPGGRSTPSASATKQDQAQEHFRKAKEHYTAGRYRAAITELELAHSLDPQAAELVYNLALIHEKLGDIDDAIRYYRRYVEMTDDKAEKARIQGVIHRLEGARDEVEVAEASSSATAPAPAPPPPEPPKKGRMDGWVIGTGALAGVALLAGGYFGYKAWNDRVDDPPTTGPGRSFAQLQDDADRAHREAIFADAGFGLAIVAGATSAILYFTRDAKAQSSATEPVPSSGDQARLTPVVTLVRGGAAAGLGFGF